MQSAFRAHKNHIAQMAAAGAYTILTWQDTAFNVGGHFDTSAGKWTPPAGIVHLSCSIWQTTHVAGISGSFALKFLKNGGDVAATVGSPVVGWTGPLGWATAHCSVVDLCSGADSYQVEWFTTSDDGVSAGMIDGNPSHTHFSGLLLG